MGGPRSTVSDKVQAMRRRHRILAVIPAFVLVSAAVAVAQAPAPAITVIPRPASVVERPGTFVLSARTTVWTDAAAADLGRWLSRALEPATGFRLAVRSAGTPSGPSIVLRRDRTLAKLGPEGYRLDVDPARITIRAPELAGVFYGIQTLRQLLPAEIFRDAKVGEVKWTVPGVRIEDQPRFSYRGAHLDCGRHFMPKEFVKKYIDLLALHKMNVFQWHLTEDQGWRIEIKKYPRLTEVGAWRTETIVGRQSRDKATWQFDGVRHGGFYTQDDIREVVAYARDRFITVIPEIEMPGHAIAAIAAYPELGVDAAGTTVATTFGVFDNILNPTDATVRFMQDVLTEVMGLFQSWFIKQMDAFLTAHKRRLAGWDEILEGGLAPGAVVTSWRGIKGGIAAARANHDVVMAPTSNTYFDYYQSKATSLEPLAIGGYLPLETVYAFEPVPPELEPQYRRHILGAQGQVWTEYLKTPKQVEYMAFPRMSALAEVVWTPADQKDFADFSARLGAHLRRLAILDVNYRAPRPEAGTASR
jgi:hexosaminidase